MKNLYGHLEHGFEKLTSVAIAILSNSISFIIALIGVIYWLTDEEFFKQSLHDSIENIILGVAFLSLFIIQKSFNRFSKSLHLKVNELVASHEPANNAVIHAEEKTEHEISKLSEAQLELVEQIKQEDKSNL
ncbi:MAG TPA: low affinity iron permease family protein, partial [Flavobacterium sp.]|nr:low affinity iron permease family protein [Flavobacterium sp.]